MLKTEIRPKEMMLKPSHGKEAGKVDYTYILIKTYSEKLY